MKLKRDAKDVTVIQWRSQLKILEGANYFDFKWPT